jgi:uncharacterized protein YcfJ|tara:strand:- start:56 stop:334 length:279 start_codon:yes stop_codon:yes gene_type:complete
VGSTVGAALRVLVGAAVGADVGLFVIDVVGATVGDIVGAIVSPFLIARGLEGTSPKGNTIPHASPDSFGMNEREKACPDVFVWTVSTSLGFE